MSIVVICSKRTMLPPLRNVDGGTGYCPGVFPVQCPYRDYGVSQNDAVIYAVEILLLPAGNFAILSG